MGGGGNTPTPGEITLSHCGVLFLDELPHFKRSALDLLREPIETCEIASQELDTGRHFLVVSN